MVDEEVFFQDDDVCILYPHVKRGILIFSKFTSEAVHKQGLLSGEEIRRRNPNHDNRSIHHDVIFFRAPFRYADENLPLKAYYEDNLIANLTTKTTPLFVIRIDPDQTYVYSSEARTHDFDNKMRLLRRSRKSLNQYMDVIEQNKVILPPSPYGWTAQYNIITGIKSYIAFQQHEYKFESVHNNGIYTSAPNNRNSEILVHIPVIPTSIAVEII